MEKKISLILGTFDGVHIAHQKIIAKASDNGFNPVAVTIAQVPKAFFSGNEIKPIMSKNDRKAKLLEFGVKQIDTLDFLKIKNDSPDVFLQKINNKYHPKKICTGYNYRFGKERSGDISLLSEFCRKNQIEFIVEEEIKIDGLTVSSTNIRAFLKNGEMQKANKMLGYNYFIQKKVVHGNALGRKMGFATINQNIDMSLTTLLFGVYASVVNVDGVKYRAVTNFGIKPTIGGKKVIAESHILDFKKDIYGKLIKTEFLQFLRPEIRFNNIDELKAAINKDIDLRQQIK